MIVDFGCLDQPDLARKFFSALPGAVAAFATVAGLAVIGALLNRSKRFQAYDVFSGFSVVAVVMTLAAVFFTKALPFVTLTFFVLIALAIIPALKRRIFVAPFWLLALFPGLFILTALNIAGVAKWDDFSHWVPNALYVFQNDGVPGIGQPVSHSVWPSYPYAVPFITYLESWLLGGFLVQGGAMVSFLLLTAFAAMLVETLSPTDGKKPLSLKAIGKTAFALLYVTLLSPGFNASFSMTNEGDTPTTVLIAALALLLWQTINWWREKDAKEARTFALPQALIGMALVVVKQSNLSLLGLLTIGFLTVAVKNRFFKPAFIRAVLILVPALIVRTAWQHYVEHNMPGQIFGLRPFTEWRFDLLGPILLSMLQAMIKSNGLTILMLGVSIYGLISLFLPAKPSRNFAVMAGVTYAGYLWFLLMAYVGADFGEVEAKRATSFYRYCTHTSLIGMTMLWMSAPALWKWFKLRIGKPRFAIPGFVAMPIVRVSTVVFAVAILPIAYLIHGHWIVPQASPEICAVRAFGHKLAEALPDHARVASLEPETDALFTYIVDMEFGLEEARSKKTVNVAWCIDRSRFEFDRAKMPEYLDRIAADPNITTILVPKAEHEPLSIKGYNNSTGPLVLERSGKKWKPLSLPSP